MILDVVLNIVAQLMFFIVNIFVIPWLVNIFIDMFGEAKLPKWFSTPVTIVRSWTTHFLYTTVIDIPILFLTGNSPNNFDISVDRGALRIRFNKKSIKEHWYNPIIMLGQYFTTAAWVLIDSAIVIFLLWVILPNTFGSVVEGLEQWTVLQSGTTNLEYFKEMLDAFIDIVWNRLVINGLNENAVLLVILIFIFMTYSDHFCSFYKEGKSTPLVFLLPMPAIIIVLFNIIFATVDPAMYSIATPYINSVGMIVLLVIILKEMLDIALWCFKLIIKIVLKIIG